MSQKIEKKLKKIPILNKVVFFLKKIKFRKSTFSLYDLLELYILGIIEGAVTYRASAISYSFFVAIFPFLLFILNLIPYVPLENFQHDFWTFINEVLPPGTHDFFTDIFFDIANKKRVGLLSSVFVLSIFLMTNGINAIFGGFEYSYHTKAVRNVFKQYFIALGVAILLAFILLFSVVLYLFFEVYVAEYFRSINMLYAGELIVHWGKVIFLIIIMYFITSTLYYFGTIEGKYSRFFSTGSFFTTLLFILTTYLFGIYIENFSKYNQLYGSIGALLIFMFYIWLNSIIILLGFELNVSLLRLKDKDNNGILH